MCQSFCPRGGGGEGVHGRVCVCDRGAYMVGAVHGGFLHAAEMATEVGGMHPTGMHSCFECASTLNDKCHMS